jgi:hypothetical protein
MRKLLSHFPLIVVICKADLIVLFICGQGTNMLSRLLHVRHPIAKQAVITAIDLLGQ